MKTTLYDQHQIETEHLAAVERHNEQRERQLNTRAAVCTCGDSVLSKLACTIHGNPQINQAAEMARLIRKIEDMEFSIMRAINWSENGYRKEAKEELMKWVRR